MVDVGEHRNQTKELRLKVFRFNVEGEKCGGCNWSTTVKYVMAVDEEEAKKLLNEGLAGLCGDCLCDLLAEGEYEIVSKN